ncbi:MAG: radical SAM protein, partial [bacterium]
MSLDGAALSFEWRFDELPGEGTRLTQHIVLRGQSAAAYLPDVQAAFTSNLAPGMSRIARAIERAEASGLFAREAGSLGQATSIGFGNLMRYDIEADWILLQTCNYRCSYCFASPQTLGQKLRTFATPQQWRAAFDATDRTWLLHITGGEPSIYPGLVDLCETLAERHYLSLNSNLTHGSLADFARRVDPSRVNFINAGFHLEERDRRSGHAAFVANGEALCARGFSLLVSLVATPAALERFDDAATILRPLGLVPIPKLFRGVHQGSHYPEAYSPLDKKRFAYCARLARECYAPILERMAERPSVDLFGDDE